MGANFLALRVTAALAAAALRSRLGGSDGAGLGAVADGLRGLLGEELELALLGNKARVT